MCFVVYLQILLNIFELLLTATNTFKWNDFNMTFLFMNLWIIDPRLRSRKLLIWHNNQFKTHKEKLYIINDKRSHERLARLVYYMGWIRTSNIFPIIEYKCQKLEFFTSFLPLKIPGTKNDITSMQMTVNNKTKIMDFK
ncbi:hypothetical protein RIR_jg28058.t1 [Rhizophagus irregularis DAOM 181602=DAOM 197198]|nr:hypothetical protein RIR_jg28058.t1 [Rhizophagus irregularis DAOM 181602=DAOM 197198]CAB4373738.1 unnamed protein product [Rhizophagus irregularis]CAB5358036.1 unnamed protein product [Rhizophagus irregularis]